jgi:hypothetical protein
MFEDYTQELDRLSKEKIDLSSEYKEARLSATKSRISYQIKLASIIDIIKGDRKTISYEMSEIESLKLNNDEVTDLYREKEEQEALYKGLEKVIEAYTSRIMAIQSLMKYNINGEWGEHD